MKIKFVFIAAVIMTVMPQGGFSGIIDGFTKPGQDIFWGVIVDSLKSPMSYTLITREDIVESGAQNLTELLEIYVAGFQYMYNPFYGRTLWGMRGISSDRNTKFIVLINNHKINMQSRDGFKSELTLGMLNDIDRIEVLRGPASPVYGSGAIAGIINITTRGNAKGTDRAEQSNSMEVSYSYGNVNGNEIDAYFTKSIDVGNTIRMSIGRRHSDGMSAHQSRLYSTPPWPFPNPYSDSTDTIRKYWEKNGVPSEGNHNATPGNYKLSGEWDVAFNDDMNLDAYFRFTRQVENAAGLFIQDAWPEIIGEPKDSIWAIGGDTIIVKAPSGNVDGRSIGLNDSMYEFWKSTESYGDNRRQYVNNNIMAFINYSLNLPSSGLYDHKLNINVGIDGVSNMTVLEKSSEYHLLRNKMNGTILETFGEKRCSPGVTYLIQKNENQARHSNDWEIEDWRITGNTEYRWDDIGNDLLGRNQWAGNLKHKIVSDINFHTFTLSGEGLLGLKGANGNVFYFTLGGRFDLNCHNKTKFKYDDTTQPDLSVGRNCKNMKNLKVAVVFKPNKSEKLSHSYKFMFQQSSNNGTADNYLPNRYNYNIDGSINYNPIFEDYTKDSGLYRPIIRPFTEEKAKNLNPEQIKSVEIAMTQIVGENFAVMNSWSYGFVQDLFAWSQNNFSIQNSGEYEFINWDADIKWYICDRQGGKKVTFGINNTAQRCIDLLSKESNSMDTLYIYKVNRQRDTIIPIEKSPIPLDMVKDAITADNKNFLNLSTCVTKLYITYHPFNWFSFHSNCRIFWGLRGRKKTGDIIWEKKPFDDGMGTGDSIIRFIPQSAQKTDSISDLFEDLGVYEGKPILKLNVSLHFHLSDRMALSLFAYNILGKDNCKSEFFRRNSLRWLQRPYPQTKGLVSTDQQSFAVKLTYSLK